ncbi:MAG: preprotein translocase subunit YajC [Citromicrobium sp.]|nr:MAG: preprotein translocase subunit YajC [Citromicrobium sp.]
MTRAGHLFAILSLASAGPLMAQAGPAPSAQVESREESDGERDQRRTRIDPYIEASQIFTQQFEPVDDFVTYTQIAAGVDASINGRRSGATVAVRYERNFAWEDNANSNDRISGIARGYYEIVPRKLQIEAGALASRSNYDGYGNSIFVPVLGDDDRTTTTYALYAGPRYTDRIGDVQVDANYQIGYTRVEEPDSRFVDDRIYDLFDESISHSANVRAATSPGDPLPVGLGVGAGFYQEDIETLDQRVRDFHVRGDVTYPISRTLALVGGVGYEDVEVSSRDAVRDAEGNPVIDENGRYLTDPQSPRLIAYEADGLIWDVGVIWRPSSRTELQASFGRRYASDTFRGNFSWQPSQRSNVNVSVYDQLQGFGGRLTNSLSLLPADFNVIRDPITGDITGCTSLIDGSDCLGGVLGSARSSIFRARGISASYFREIGRTRVGIGGGYDNRKFIAAPGTILEASDGLTDENYYLFLSGETPFYRGMLGTNAYASWFKNGSSNLGNSFSLGSSVSYEQLIYRNLSARAALSAYMIDNEISNADLRAISALIGLRYDF